MSILVSILTTVFIFIFIFIHFSKAAWEQLWKFLLFLFLFLFLFCSGQAQHIVLTFKYISKKYITHSNIVQSPLLAKMVKTASPLLSPGKNLEAKLLLHRQMPRPSPRSPIRIQRLQSQHSLLPQRFPNNLVMGTRVTPKWR